VTDFYNSLAMSRGEETSRQGAVAAGDDGPSLPRVSDMSLGPPSSSQAEDCRGTANPAGRRAQNGKRKRGATGKGTSRSTARKRPRKAPEIEPTEDGGMELAEDDGEPPAGSSDSVLIDSPPGRLGEETRRSISRAVEQALDARLAVFAESIPVTITTACEESLARHLGAMATGHMEAITALTSELGGMRSELVKLERRLQSNLDRMRGAMEARWDIIARQAVDALQSVAESAQLRHSSPPLLRPRRRSTTGRRDAPTTPRTTANELSLLSEPSSPV